jgi:hypothetical protein
LESEMAKKILKKAKLWNFLKIKYIITK